mgnify:CR=1 FL=1|tara:strand:+ start:879 stop:1040 length:162 start_codon:yes stop_codon:yes gene_type:complete
MNGQHHGGKGSAQRPTDQDKFNDNWDSIFAPKDKEVENAEVPSNDGAAEGPAG